MTTETGDEMSDVSDWLARRAEGPWSIESTPAGLFVVTVYDHGGSARCGPVSPGLALLIRDQINAEHWRSALWVRGVGGEFVEIHGWPSRHIHSIDDNDAYVHAAINDARAYPPCIWPLFDAARNPCVKICVKATTVAVSKQ